MPRSRLATGEKTKPTRAATATASTSPTIAGRPAPASVGVDSDVAQT